MIIQFSQEAFENINGLVDCIHAEATMLRLWDSANAITSIIETTYQLKALLKEGVLEETST